ncbi:MAG: hypothetical protein SOX68_06200 [Faecalicoccus sp.]|uniref:hypothetical protein n=1 Tax=Faecalicoccus TaxID=1573536 RepID=UPI0019621809|nr:MULTISPECIES: hypothetical protein [Faecalicoccus]MBM6809154.1 hypothetical protein [Faecalicoccus pleomorphus]MDB7985731.1 hypothetical protein [Faecalicoccus pleomorphus]MDB7991259.1 hypothetical protein [Faecalicoccus pleomorphus]MDY4278529.1 hypothetical protein [Faecalicoccus sp.]
MAKRDNNVRKTAARIIMDTFIKRKATSPEKAIPIEEFKDVKLSTSVISYTIANFMEDEVVYKTGDDRYYFSQENWKKLEKKVTRGYWVMVAIPVVCLVAVLLLRHINDLIGLF